MLYVLLVVLFCLAVLVGEIRAAKRNEIKTKKTLLAMIKNKKVKKQQWAPIKNNLRR